jgi:hypothetical protein
MYSDDICHITHRQLIENYLFVTFIQFGWM